MQHSTSLRESGPAPHSIQAHCCSSAGLLSFQVESICPLALYQAVISGVLVINHHWVSGCGSEPAGFSSGKQGSAWCPTTNQLLRSKVTLKHEYFREKWRLNTGNDVTFAVCLLFPSCGKFYSMAGLPLCHLVCSHIFQWVFPLVSTLPTKINTLG